MTTAYTSLLGLALPVTGELSGTWGDTVNNSITSLLDSAVAGTTNVSTDTDVTLTTTTGAANTAREAILLFSGARTALRTVTAPAQSKIYTVINATTGGYSVKLVGAGPTTGVTIVAGESAVCAWNGSDFIKISNTGGSASFTNVTVTGTTTLSGLTASTALALDASKNVVSVTNTGTGNNVLSASPTLTGTIGAAALTLSSDLTLSGGTANGVAYLNGSKVVTSGSALTFDGTTLQNSATNAKLSALNVGGTGGGGLYLGSGASTDFILNFDSTPYVKYNSVNSWPHTWTFGATEGMRLTSTGLGIGTSSPAEKLAVAGNVTADIYKFRSNQSAPSSTDAFIYRPADNTIGFGTASAEKMRLDSSGNLGLGVTPSAWGSSYKAIDVASIGASFAGSSYGVYVTSNAYQNGTNWIYKADTYGAANYNQFNGGHVWYSAPAGTAGNAITFTQAMTLFASGSLALGSTSDPTGGHFSIGPDSGKTSGSLMWLANTGGRIYVGKESSAGGTIITGTSAYAGVIGTNNAYPLQFGTNNAVSATIDTSGNLGLGVTDPATYGGVFVARPTSGANFVVRTLAGLGGSGTGVGLDAQANASSSVVDIGIRGNSIQFRNSGSEAARIDSSGNFCYGVSSFSAANNGFLVSASGASTYTAHANGTSSGATYSYFYYNNSEIGSITQSGTTAVLYNITSDQRLKENIQDADSASSLIDSLQVRKFDWKADQTHQRYGFIAQELLTVAPEAVHQPEDTEQMMAVDYSKLVPMLVKEVQSLRKRLADAGI